MTETRDLHGDARIVWIDRAVIFFFCVLIFFLPIAHTPTIRALALFIPLGLLMCRMWIVRDFEWHKTAFELPLLFFFIAAVISIPFSVNALRSLREVWGELITPVLLFCSVYLGIRRERDAAPLLFVFFMGSLVFSCYSFYDFSRHGGSWLTFTTYKAGGLRDPGGGEVAALYHTIVIPFLFWGGYYFRKPWQRVAIVLLLFINLAALHITFVRAAAVALGIQIFLVVFMLALKRQWRMSILLLFFLVLIGGIYVQNKVFREMQTAPIPSIREFIEQSPEQLAGPSSKGMQQRLGMWKTALVEIGKNPFYPHGYGRFLFGKIVRTEKNKDFIFSQVHNTYIGIAFELGVQGLILFLWMIGTFMVVCWKNWHKTLHEELGLAHYMAASLVVMMAGYWVNNFFGSFDAGDSKLFFMLLLGLGMAVMRNYSEARNERLAW